MKRSRLFATKAIPDEKYFSTMDTLPLSVDHKVGCVDTADVVRADTQHFVDTLKLIVGYVCRAVGLNPGVIKDASCSELRCLKSVETQISHVSVVKKFGKRDEMLSSSLVSGSELLGPFLGPPVASKCS
ncbi:hypothetical protein TNCV_2558171 [Trichonephila clavipes]|nr:hypothetical protein TNCV_2558171 [Trichonephila clavipes]